jgi:hypothetical protein
MLISPRKVPVVFLRRFGLTRSNDITRRAFSRYLRGRFRLLTLDDKLFAASPFRLRDAGVTVSTAILISISFVTASQASCQRAIDYEERNQVWVSFGERIFYDLMRSANTVFVVVAASVATTGLVIAIALVWWSRRTVAITRASELFRLSWLERRLRNRLWSPLLTNPTIVVTTVAHDQWQAAVRTLVHTRAPVLIDVSRPGEGLLWEIAELTKSNLPMILIAEASEFRQWRDARHDPLAQQLTAAVGDREILKYDASRSSAARDLARALRLALPAGGGPRLTLRFAGYASIACVIYLVITLEVMPWPGPAADWVNDMLRLYFRSMFIYSLPAA